MKILRWFGIILWHIRHDRHISAREGTTWTMRSAREGETEGGQSIIFCEFWFLQNFSEIIICLKKEKNPSSLADIWWFDDRNKTGDKFFLNKCKKLRSWHSPIKIVNHTYSFLLLNIVIVGTFIIDNRLCRNEAKLQHKRSCWWIYGCRCSQNKLKWLNVMGAFSNFTR